MLYGYVFGLSFSAEVQGPSACTLVLTRRRHGICLLDMGFALWKRDGHGICFMDMEYALRIWNQVNQVNQVNQITQVTQVTQVQVTQVTQVTQVMLDCSHLVLLLKTFPVVVRMASALSLITTL